MLTGFIIFLFFSLWFFHSHPPACTGILAADYRASLLISTGLCYKIQVNLPPPTTFQLKFIFTFNQCKTLKQTHPNFES